MAAGIEPDPAKTERIKDYPTPADTTEVRRFLGLASHYHLFAPKFASIAAPINALTRKGVPYQWTGDCEASFNQLKTALTTAPVLKYPTFGPGNCFILETDASTVGLGAVKLKQTEQFTPLPMPPEPLISMKKTMESLSLRLLGSCGPSDSSIHIC